MTASTDYLFDRSGEVDREIDALERLFAPLAHDGRALPPGFVVAAPAARVRRWPLLVALAAALLLAVGWLFGTRTVDAGPVQLQRGEAARTVEALDATRVVQAEDLLVANLQQGGELRVLTFDDLQLSLQVVRGRVQFDVPTPSAKGAPELRVEVLGAMLEPSGFERCLLRLDAAAEQVVLHVEQGEVVGRSVGRTFVIPAGASWTIRNGRPGWPLFDDSSEALREAVAGAGELEAKLGPEVLGKVAFGIVEAAKTPRDTLVLWHLLQLGPIATDYGVEARLLELVGVPGKQPAKAWSQQAWLDHLRQVAWRSPK